MKRLPRIIGGRYRSRFLQVPCGIRPTKSLLKESLFNIIGPSLLGKSFVDLFAGSGAIGIEAISRGAEPVLFVEHDAACARVIRENLRTFSLDTSYVFRLDAFSFFRKELDLEFDCIFCDPPYAYDDLSYERLVNSIYPILNKDGVLIVEHLRGRKILSDALCFYDKRDYGDSSLSFFRYS